MKFSKPILFFGCAGLGLTLAYSQQSNTAAQQKALDALHQTLTGPGPATPAAPAKPAAPFSTASTPSREQLLADVERLHNEGRITDQQYATFKKNIQEQYASTAAPSQSQALAQKALAQKIQQLKTGMTSPVPAPAAQPVAAPAAPTVVAAPSNTEAQIKAQKALQAQAKSTPPAAPKAPAPAPKPATVAAPVAVAAAAPARTLTPQRTNTIPASTYSTLSPQQEAQAREILRQKIAESNAQVPPPKAAAAPVVTATPRPTPAPAPARAAATPTPAPSAAPAPVAAATTPAPAPNPRAQAVAEQALHDEWLGISPGTPELVRILRVTIAEQNGVITATESQGIPLASRFYGPSPWAVAATDPKTQIPYPTKNPQGLVQLNQLNNEYRANLISPGEYHQQRVKILATL